MAAQEKPTHLPPLHLHLPPATTFPLSSSSWRPCWGMEPSCHPGSNPGRIQHYGDMLLEGGMEEGTKAKDRDIYIYIYLYGWLKGKGIWYKIQVCYEDRDEGIWICMWNNDYFIIMGQVIMFHVLLFITPQNSHAMECAATATVPLGAWAYISRCLWVESLE